MRAEVVEFFEYKNETTLKQGSRWWVIRKTGIRIPDLDIQYEERVYDPEFVGSAVAQLPLRVVVSFELPDDCAKAAQAYADAEKEFAVAKIKRNQAATQFWTAGRYPIRDLAARKEQEEFKILFPSNPGLGVRRKK